jgi:hypothetical protein
MPARKPKKHPKDMTTEEAIKYLFHPRVVKHLKKEAGSERKRTTKK